jgi:hypothetical protein
MVLEEMINYGGLCLPNNPDGAMGAWWNAGGTAVLRQMSQENEI